MNTPIDLLSVIKNGDLKLSKSDTKIAQIVCDQPNEVIHLSIAALAELANVSEPTVNRFCRKLGCDGYPDFKLTLAQQLSSSNQLYIENIDRENGSGNLIAKILDSINQGTIALANSIDPLVLEESAEAICRCTSVNLFGMGASSTVAMDAQHKLFRFGIPVVAHTDFITQRMVCSMLSHKDVAIYISYTGRTKQLIEHCEIAKQNNAVILTITDANSPLAQLADHKLHVAPSEDTDLFTPMTSRLMHLAVVDMLTAMVALKLGDRITPSIKNIKKSITSTRIDEDS